jgi:hypothetical protein
MIESDIEALQYPIGRQPPAPSALTVDARRDRVRELASAPGALGEAVTGLTVEQLDTRYRPEGWTVRQVVHHLADSHLFCASRVRAALTADRPAVSDFAETMWANLSDAQHAPVEHSLALFASLHARLDLLFRDLEPAAYAREVEHPTRGRLSVDAMLTIYAWHARHHTAQIMTLRSRQGW